MEKVDRVSIGDPVPCLSRRRATRERAYTQPSPSRFPRPIRPRDLFTRPSSTRLFYLFFAVLASSVHDRIERFARAGLMVVAFFIVLSLSDESKLGV